MDRDSCRFFSLKSLLDYASHYWGIDQSVTYGDETNILNTTAGIVDTGTTLLLLATDAFQNYERATGGKLDKFVTLRYNCPRNAALTTFSQDDWTSHYHQLSI